MVSQSIVPEVDEEAEEKTANTLSDVLQDPEGSSKTFKRKPSLVELVLVSAYPPCPFAVA